MTEMKDLQKERRKEADLSAMKSQIDGLETRLKFAKKDKEATVCYKKEWLAVIDLTSFSNEILVQKLVVKI